MKRSRSIGAAPTGQETAGGFVYLVFQFVFLPSILYFLRDRLDLGWSEAELNFVYYLLNFLAVLVIFHGYLGRSAGQILQHPVRFAESLVLGLAGYYACLWLANALIGLLAPDYANYNDASIAAMYGGNSFLMVIGTVVLVPPAEECLFRGLIFRNLYPRSPWAAYCVSILAFAAIHILGYIGLYSPLELTMAVLQYLPAGLCLAWSYARSETIFAPILIHAAVNYITITALR